MNHLPNRQPAESGGVGWFGTTHWSVVLLAGKDDNVQAAEAMGKLCRTYWYPLYAFVRRSGHDPADAQDLTQEFFARFLAKNYLANVDPSKGKFRSFLLASMKHFLAKEWARAKALKRGGGKTVIPLDADSAETRYIHEPADNTTPDTIYERRWALTLLDNVLTCLHKEYQETGKGPLFEQLQGCLAGDKSLLPYAELSSRLNMTEGAIKVAIHRLRHRYRNLLRENIAQTVSSPQEVDDEIRYLFRALQK